MQWRGIKITNKESFLLGNIFSKFWKETLDYIFPKFCLGCKIEGYLVCLTCLENYERCIEPISTSFFNYNHIALANYNESDLLGNIIYSLKYNFLEEMYFPIQYLFMSAFEKLNIYDYDYIIPIPLHKKRFAERGFNQAKTISKALSSVINLPILDALSRIKHTKQQARLNRKDRLTNVLDAFELNRKLLSEQIKDKSVIVVDDVFTTGSTMKECVSVLLSAGAKNVLAITLAKG